MTTPKPDDGRGGDLESGPCPLCQGFGKRYIVNPWSSNPRRTAELVTCCDCEGVGRRPLLNQPAPDHE